MGDNNYGELGIPDCSFTQEPKKVTFFDEKKLKVLKVCTGARHTLVLTHNNKVYAFGDNSEGQCSGFDTTYNVPTKVKFMGRDRIVDIYTGYNHSIALADKGEIYTWGDCSFNKLGYHSLQSVQTRPKPIPYLQGLHVSYISAGSHQQVIVTSDYMSSILYNKMLQD